MIKKMFLLLLMTIFPGTDNSEWKETSRDETLVSLAGVSQTGGSTRTLKGTPLRSEQHRRGWI